MRHLSISDVTMRFSRGPAVLEKIRLDIARGEYVAIIGHSGCGKSTLLNIVAGPLVASDGGVILDGTEVNAPGPDRAVVFQNHSLLPWLTCRENVRLAVDQVFGRSKSRAERAAWVDENLDLVHMPPRASSRAAPTCFSPRITGCSPSLRRRTVSCAGCACRMAFSRTGNSPASPISPIATAAASRTSRRGPICRFAKSRPSTALLSSKRSQVSD